MSDDLFQDPAASAAPVIEVDLDAPLASRMRPQTLSEYTGQRHILGEGKLLRRAVQADRFSSIILYGPPGVGKTTLAHIISQETRARFVTLSGVESSVADIRKEAEAASKLRKLTGQGTVLFVDEIHRFNKAQQDVLLPHLERGTLRFIGATTHNPFFYVNSPLVSRSQVFTLEPLGIEDLQTLMQRALMDEARGLGKWNAQLTAEASLHLATIADGDARKCLNALELAVLSSVPDADQRITIDLLAAEESVQQKTVVYDGDGDAHYDTASAFIKSMRASDPDAAIYWLAKMLYAGEDIRFIARRIVIAASEDVGMADSNALRVAVTAQQAVEVIGMPEARIILAHAVIYIATAPKSNRAYMAINAALEDVKMAAPCPCLSTCVTVITKERSSLAMGRVTCIRMTSRADLCRSGVSKAGGNTMSPPRMVWRGESRNAWIITVSSGKKRSSRLEGATRPLSVVKLPLSKSVILIYAIRPHDPCSLRSLPHR